jgi:small subunit ribosomal protein S16
MLKIRLARIGRKNDPTFRVVVTNSQNGPKAGKHTELLGVHNSKMKETTLNADRIKYWMSKGAQVSDTMHNLLITHKVIDGKKINVLPKKSPIITEKEAGEETTPAPAGEAITPSETTPTPEVTDEHPPTGEEAPVESAPTASEEVPAEAETPQQA